VARPMPLPAPVTMATCPSSFFMGSPTPVLRRAVRRVAPGGPRRGEAQWDPFALLPRGEVSRQGANG
jgi:hypothetical protein